MAIVDAIPAGHQTKGRWGPRGTAAATFAARLSFEGVSHRYGRTTAIQNVSFELAPGEIVCLLGPSGCGKTTLLRIAAGVERPWKGRVLLNGQEVAGPNAFVPPERRGVGLMFQDFALFPHLSIIDNVAFGLRGLDRAAALGEARAALRRVGLVEYEKAFPYMLSGGEQQRVALARAIVPRPAVLLMDEPFSGLDQRLRDSVREETLAILRETRASSLLVTHDADEAMYMADRIALMREGRLIQIGRPAELYCNPVDADAARFFSDFNEFDGTVRNAAIDTPLGRIPAGRLPDGTPVTVMVRPQGVLVGKGSSGSEATVLEARFLGSTTLVSLGFEALDQPVYARVFGQVELERGTSVRCGTDPQHVLTFPTEPVV